MDHFIKILTLPDNIPIVGMLFLLIFFFWLSIKQMRDNDRMIEAGDFSKMQEEGKDRVFVWPYLTRIEFLAAILVMLILTVWSIGIDAPLEAPADPTHTPNPSKAPWYFLGLQEILVYFDPWIAGVLVPTLIIVGLMAIPYIDINPKGNGYYTWKERKFAITTFCFGFLVLWIALIILGTFMRGPGWNFFAPWQEWDVHKVVALTNVDLSEKLGVRSYAGSFILGAVIVLGYFSLGAVYYYWKRGTSDFLQKLGGPRYAVFAFLFMTMMSLPIKIFLRLAFNIKYIWVTPWFNI